MKRRLFAMLYVVALLSFIPVAAHADGGWWDDDWDDDYYEYDCYDLCTKVASLCAVDCVPASYAECHDYCESHLDQDRIDCAQHKDCSDFSDCLCGGEDDDAQVDDDAAKDDADSGDDDDDSKDGFSCSVSRGRQSTALTVFMFVVGISAFIFSLSTGRKPKK